MDCGSASFGENQCWRQHYGCYYVGAEVETTTETESSHCGRLLRIMEKKVIYTCPVYKSVKIDSSKIILSFEYIDKDLALKGIKDKNQFYYYR